MYFGKYEKVPLGRREFMYVSSKRYSLTGFGFKNILSFRREKQREQYSSKASGGSSAQNMLSSTSRSQGPTKLVNEASALSSVSLFDASRTRFR